MTLTDTQVRELIDAIILADDGAHAAEFIELLNGITDPNHTQALTAKRYLFTFTAEFERSFNKFMEAA